MSLETFSAFQQHVLELPLIGINQGSKTVQESEQIQMHISSQVRMMRNLLSRAQSNKERLQNEISLVRAETSLR